MSSLGKRVLVALFGIPAILTLTYLGGIYFFIFIIFIQGMALWEFYDMFEQKEIYANRWLGLFLGSVLVILNFQQGWTFTLFVLAIAVVSILFMNLSPQRGITSLNSAITLIGILYISFLLSMALQARLIFDRWFPGHAEAIAYAGGKYFILLWGAIWICDTAAYFGGSAFGRHKLAPRISPNKTVEGAVLGFLAALATFLLLGPLFLPGFPVSFFWASGVIVGLMGQIGDLVESRFKRDAGVKDTSTILPGHGGFLDRFDSFIFVSPFIFGLLYYYRHLLG
ncbi:MAG: phosphatidate cytidylyltransferase [Calditrichaeota bacterium]|nr:phosphatidate cytidylyltransferase [Calditrichota bacterium]